MKGIYSVLFCVILSSQCIGQKIHHELPWDFHNYLTEIHDQKSMQSLSRKTDSLNTEMFRGGNARFKIDTQSSWELTYHVLLKWDHVVGQPIFIQDNERIEDFEFIVIDTTVSSDPIVPLELRSPFYPPHGPLKKQLFICENKEPFTGAELYRSLLLNSSYLLAMDTVALYGFPEIYERADPLNGKFIPFMSGKDLLIIRYVHSYPHGNMTSWYHEQLYYFERVR
jgi:hypothetical protein